MTMPLEVLHVPDCPNLGPLLDRLRLVTDEPIVTTEVRTVAEATQHGMRGSPTLLVNGRDPFQQAGSGEAALSCRLYRDEDGQIVPSPTAEQLRAAIAETECQACSKPDGVEVLSAWRRQATPMTGSQRAVHRELLRGFAQTGVAPTVSELHHGTAIVEQELERLLHELHSVDAIRLDAKGGVTVAYPFSATPTRHRVRLGDRVDVYAMCAIDALGMPAMVGEDAVIESSDPRSGDPVTVTVTGGRTAWWPGDAVAFVGAAAQGPSAECCCDFLNFFTDAQSAHAWATAHPEVPGQVLTQRDAEDLGVRLFGELLTS